MQDHASLMKTRRAGVLLHPTSLPSGHLGDAARFLDLMAEMHFSVWQILPLSPPAETSPYQSLSAHAGDVRLIDLTEMHRRRWITKRVLTAQKEPATDVDRIFKLGFSGFTNRASKRDQRAFTAFVEAEAHWLEDYALFRAIKAERGGDYWWDWPATLRDRNAKALRKARKRLSETIDGVKFSQYMFSRQWTRVHEQARELDIAIFGDLPIFVSGDSADVWANRHLFRLDELGQPRVVAGVPPDLFSDTGQRWGNPLFDWDAMAADDFAWWVARMRTQFSQVDIVRVDHFRGFEAFWEIPASAPTAMGGRWVKAPGDALFNQLRETLGELPLVAEDLGIITPEVDALRMRQDMPGMKIIQFGFDGDPNNRYLPSQHTEDSVVYTGTHDNDTAVGWFNSLDRHTQSLVRDRFPSVDRAPHVALSEAALVSPGNLAIIPMQDVLGLDGSARMNTPGETGDENWSWRLREEDLAGLDPEPWRTRIIAHNRSLRADTSATTQEATPDEEANEMTNQAVSFEPAALDLDALDRIRAARHHDPFTVLGRHLQSDGMDRVVVFRPDAERVQVGDDRLDMTDEGGGIFVWEGPVNSLRGHYKVHASYPDGVVDSRFDPYSFAAQVSDFDLHLFSEGTHYQAYRFLGAHKKQVDGIDGATFAVWAPGAERVSVVGDFNQWDGRLHAMRVRGSSGVWEIFVPEVAAGSNYKYEIRTRNDGAILTKTDPYGQQFQLRPQTAAVIPAIDEHEWQDTDWLERRANTDWQRAPMSVYEVHLGSWQRTDEGGFLSYRELAHRLVAYVGKAGYTHIELMPIMEHPLDMSWGYQTTGYFAPTARFGDPEGFRYFVDHCHQNGIGVIVDWAPGHFPRDTFALASFDGTALYEHADPRRGAHPDWGTLIFNYGRAEVRSFLLSSAVYWLDEFHIDGIRVDAVASMLYLDYSREPNAWIPNAHGGNENIEAVSLLRHLNQITHGTYPGTITIAEESTAWPAVTRPTEIGGLGFSMKWNMGWMHDSLEYMANDPIHRKYHHNKLTFGLLYSFSENFLLPFSHDEVVHGKGSMFRKMPGDHWQRMANLRLLYAYQWTYPGKKLMFMGSEFAQDPEWNEAASLDWDALEFDPKRRGLLNLISDLNRLYRTEKPLHATDFFSDGFDWIDCNDAEQSVLVSQRLAGDESLIVIANFTPVPRHHYRIGVPSAGGYLEVMNTDSAHYGGSNIGNGGFIASEPKPWMNQQQSVSLTLPPLSVVVLRPEHGSK